MPHAEVNGQRLYYEVEGGGEPLFLVMGLGMDRAAWALQMPAWSQRFRVVSFDNRDVGRSSYADGPYEIADMARDALALADHLELESFHLVGLSMGGAIAQEMALSAPDRIRTLTLCVTWGGYGRRGQQQTRLAAAQVARGSREELVDMLLVQCFSEEFFEDERQVSFMRRAMLANPYPQEPQAFVRQLEACGRHETRDRLERLADLPVHVIAAEHDLLVPPWKTKELAGLIPGAWLSVLPTAAHALNLERADEFNALVTGFIDEHAP
jgi:pimeloyl-ACP methyl ester carboxylesterase